MKYLFIDTSANSLIIAIIENNKVIYCFNNTNISNTSSKIMAEIDEAFSKTNLKIKDIDKVFIVNGPGSFTGIRVGVTVAKIVGFCLNIPLVPLSELELLATTKTETKYNIPLIDARRGYVYGAIYDQDLNPYFKETHILLSQLEKEYPLDYTIIDSTNAKIDLLKIIKKHEFDQPINPHNLKPNYLKKTEAEENLDAKRS